MHAYKRKNLAPLPRRRPHWEWKTGKDCRGAGMLLGCCSQRVSSIRSPEPGWSRVSRVTRLQLRVFVTTVVLMLSRAWSRVRAARREAAERAVARARSWLQPSPAQPSQPSPAQPSPAPHLELEPETWTREAVVAATAALHQ